MDKVCKNCKYAKQNYDQAPCADCCDWSTGEDAEGDYKNFVPSRKALERELDEANQRIAELEREREINRGKIPFSPSISMSYIHKIATNEREMRLMNDIADLQKRYDELLTTTNAEIASMHRELAAKERETAENRRNVSLAMRREAEAKANVSELAREINVLNQRVKDAKELAYRRLRLALNIGEKLGDAKNELADAREIIAEQNRELDEALAVCTELADWASEWKRMYLESSNK